MDDKQHQVIRRIEDELADLQPDILEALRKRFESRSYSVQMEAHHATYSRLFRIPTASTCAKTNVLLIAGQGEVNSRGITTVPIVFCGLEPEAGPYVIVNVVSFLATPHGSRPAFLTTSIRATPGQVRADEYVDRGSGFEWAGEYLEDVLVDVMAWQSKDEPAPNTPFSWYCMVQLAKRGFIGG